MRSFIHPLLLACTTVLYLTCTKEIKSCGKKIPGMACIPAGEFIRGSNDHEADEKPQEKIFLSEYYIDIHEVTNKAFNECLAAGKCRECLKTKKCDHVGARYGARYKGENQPVNGISWFTAKEYCEFRGLRLPTEAEWEKAARGTDGNLYPWGNETATCERAVIQVGEGKKGIKGCFPKRLEPEWHMHTAAVMSRPAGVYGLYDMAGNVHEWVNDWYAKSYAACGDKCRGRDPKGPCDGADVCPGYKERGVRGGSWWWTAPYARGSKRRSNVPGNMPMENYHHFGFRCAANP